MYDGLLPFRQQAVCQDAVTAAKEDLRS
jgi:hypothetical protein